MKKILIINIALINLFAGTFLITSCTSSEIYQPNREWHFEVIRSNHLVKDTIILKIYDDSWDITQRRIEYIYKLRNETNNTFTTIVETTGVIERKSTFFTRLFSSAEVWLHPPRSEYLRVTELLPFPWIEYPIKLGNTNDWKLTPEEGWKDYEGKEIKGKLEVTTKIFFDNSAVEDSCWVVEGIGESIFGKFTCKYYFNEQYGFVYFKYNLNDYYIEIIPLKIVF